MTIAILYLFCLLLFVWVVFAYTREMKLEERIMTLEERVRRLELDVRSLFNHGGL